MEVFEGRETKNAVEEPPTTPVIGRKNLFDKVKKKTVR